MRSRLASDPRAATIIEFAIILPVLCTLMTAGFELAYRSYLSAIVQGALLEATRRATIGDKTEAQLEQIIKDRVATITNPAYVSKPKIESFYNFSNVGKPEKITSDTDPIGVYNATDCYEDANNNGTYDLTTNTGLGTADDIVRYTVTVTYPNIMPVSGLLGWSSTQTIVASTVMRNQPFTSRAMPTIRCPG